MRAVIVGQGNSPGSADSLEIRDHPNPELAPRDVLIEVAAAGVNRADLLQRKGHYPPPPGASELLGLECSGIVSAVGPSVTRWQPGDQVCALLTGGGYAEYVAVPETQVMPIPAGVDLVSAAALPEVACTVMSNLSMTAHLQACDWVLIQGGASGVGTFAIQWAKALGAKVIVTVGSEDRAQVCRDLGADVAINYNEQDFAVQVKEVTDGRGADVILDIIGAKYLERNVNALAVGGRLVIIGLQGGIKGELNLGRLLGKQGAIFTTSLRFSSADRKAQICANVVERMWPLFEEGRLRAVVDERFPLAAAGSAHNKLEAGSVTGKLLLTVSD